MSLSDQLALKKELTKMKKNIDAGQGAVKRKNSGDRQPIRYRFTVYGFRRECLWFEQPRTFGCLAYRFAVWGFRRECLCFEAAQTFGC